MSSWALASAPTGLAHFFSTACLIAPTCGSIATSGGLPPAIFVPRKLTIGSCAGTKVTVAPVRFSNSLRTLMKLACSGPVQTAATEIFSPSSLGSETPEGVSSELLEPPPVFPFPLPPSSPQPVRASAPMAVNTMAALRIRSVVRIRAPSLLCACLYVWVSAPVRTVLRRVHGRRNTAFGVNMSIVMGS